MGDKTNLDNEIETVIQILKENTTYSPQAQAYIIHGAIQKLIEWRNSFITQNTDMEAVKKLDHFSTNGLHLLQRRTEYIVMYAHTIWKGLFFDTAERAAGVIRDTVGARFSTKTGNGRIVMENLEDGTKYVIQPIEQFLGMEDLQLPKA